eukprot:6201570-Prorocentrum_lima.AAC.1
MHVVHHKLMHYSALRSHACASVARLPVVENFSRMSTRGRVGIFAPSGMRRTLCGYCTPSASSGGR